MTKRQLLDSVEDSMELTKWFAYFKVRAEHAEEDRKQREFAQKFGTPVAGA